MQGAQANKYWRSLQHAEAGGEEHQAEESASELGSSRREFLKAAGFLFTGAAFTGCTRPPVEKALPLLDQPEGIAAGRASYYTSTCAGCEAACGLLVKTRDGRPLKLEGNPDHPLSRGGLCAVGQASILSLYDSLRPSSPLAAGKPASWEQVDQAVTARLAEIRENKGVIRFLTRTLNSPTLARRIGGFLASFPDARHVVYDALSQSAIAAAHAETHGANLIPGYRFDRAGVIASVDADFLGAWISPVEFTAGYSQGRKPESGALSYHVQFESRMSLTGTKADRRIRVAPSELGAVLAALTARLERLAGVMPRLEAAEMPGIEDAACHLWEARGRSLVVCGLNDPAAQVLTNYANHLLGNYGATLDLERTSRAQLGDECELESLLAEIETGRVQALLIHGVNPVAELPGGERLGEALGRVPLVVSFGPRLDETAGRAHYLCPDCDPLESWGDAEPVNGTLSLRQPAIRRLGNARPLIETLAHWSGTAASDYELVRETWTTEIYPRSASEEPFETFWRRALVDGFCQVKPRPQPVQNFRAEAVKPWTKRPAAELQLVLYPKPAILDGRHAYNPWLQELPDPVTKAVWDNYAAISPALARRLSIRDGDVVRLDAAGQAIELPALVQPGQQDDTVAVAVGYGRKDSERFAGAGPRWLQGKPTVNAAGRVGANAAGLLRFDQGRLCYWRDGLHLEKTGARRPLALTQDHHTLSLPSHLDPGGPPRPIVQEVAVANLDKPHEPQPHYPDVELWPRDHVFTGHRWAMVIDLNACTGCSACVLACQVENNIPVVGRDEVMRSREMHWLRVDRYYAGPPEEVTVAYQPMMCQQCEHAPCETVCPVLATVHSSEGLNQQVYNRCVGTRYCANNCPYKARRFNWFDYPRNDRLANMVLNPDVTVRSRGVMEKCTFCVQRIQEAKIEARRTGTPLRDGDIQTACQQSCPAGAIVFGDLNDPESPVSRLMKSNRRYRVLEEINVRPSVGYLKIVRQEQREEGERHG